MSVWSLVSRVREWVRRNPDLVALLLLSLAVAFVYFDVEPRKFVAFDDTGFVEKIRKVAEGGTFEGVKWSFTNLETGYWVPLTWLSFMVNAWLTGLGAGGFFAVNVVLHLFNAAAIYFIFRWATGSVVRSAVVAVLFAVHPANVQAVAWIAARKDVLSTFFGLLSILGYVRHAQGGGRWPYRLSLVAMGLSLMAKPVFVVLPFWFLLLDLWPLRRIEGGNLWARVVEKLPFAALAVLAGLLIGVAMGRERNLISIDVLSFADRTILPVTSLSFYLSKTFLPTKLAAVYPVAHTAVSGGIVLVLGAFLLGTTATAIWFFRRAPYLAIGWGWFLVGVFPVSGVFASGVELVTDRFAYVPRIGIFFAFVWGMAELATTVRWGRKAALGLGAAALLPLMASARDQVVLWREPIGLFQRAIAVTGPNYLATGLLGMSYRNDGRYAEAVECFREVTHLRPDLVTGWANLGKSLAGLGKNQEALSALQRAMEIDPSNPSALNSAGVVLVALGRPEEGIDRFRKSVSIDPNDGTVWKNLGSALTGVGRPDEAALAYGEAMSANPRDVDARHRLAVAFLQLGRPDEAVPHLEEVVRLRPDDPVARYNLGNAWDAKGRSDEAVVAYRRALELRPGYEKAEASLQRILEGRGGR